MEDTAKNPRTGEKVKAKREALITSVPFPKLDGSTKGEKREELGGRWFFGTLKKGG